MEIDGLAARTTKRNVQAFMAAALRECYAALLDPVSIESSL